MNETLVDFARENLKSGLSECTEQEQFLFKRMYSHKSLEKDINQVVDDMEEEKLDRAMQQVQRTLDKRG